MISMHLFKEGFEPDPGHNERELWNTYIYYKKHEFIQLLLVAIYIPKL